MITVMWKEEAFKGKEDKSQDKDRINLNSNQMTKL